MSAGACLEWTQNDFKIQKGDLVLMTGYLKAVNRTRKVKAEVVWIEGKKTGITFVHPAHVLEKMMDKELE